MISSDCTRRGFLSGLTVASMLAPPATAQKRTLVIDCHAHAGHAQRLTDPWETLADPEVILRHNEEAGIDQTVIFPISNHTYEKANREVAEICRRYPGKFIGYAKHDPITERGLIAKMLRYEFHELGLRGLKLHGHPGPEMLNVVEELRIPVIYHPRRVAQFDEIARNYPTVDFILTHMGSDLSVNWKEHEAAIAMAKKYPNVYLDTGATVFSRYIERAVREVGADKVVFGSDEPEVDCRLEIYKIQVLKLPKEQEELILGGTIQRLLAKAEGGAA